VREYIHAHKTSFIISTTLTILILVATIGVPIWTAYQTSQKDERKIYEDLLRDIEGSLQDIAKALGNLDVFGMVSLDLSETTTSMNFREEIIREHTIAYIYHELDLEGFDYWEYIYEMEKFVYQLFGEHYSTNIFIETLTESELIEFSILYVKLISRQIGLRYILYVYEEYGYFDYEGIDTVIGNFDILRTVELSYLALDRLWERTHEFDNATIGIFLENIITYERLIDAFIDAYDAIIATVEAM